jgi:hypothetical protein
MVSIQAMKQHRKHQIGAFMIHFVGLKLVISICTYCAPHQWRHGDPSARQPRLSTAGATALEYYGGTAAWWSEYYGGTAAWWSETAARRIK